jgi:hypothetical protein
MSGVAPPLIGIARIRRNCSRRWRVAVKFLKPPVQARVDGSHKPCEATCRSFLGEICKEQGHRVRAGSSARQRSSPPTSFLLTAIALLRRAVDREYEGAIRSQTQACGSASSCCSLLSYSSNMSISFFYRDVVAQPLGSADDRTIMRGRGVTESCESMSLAGCSACDRGGASIYGLHQGGRRGTNPRLRGTEPHRKTAARRKSMKLRCPNERLRCERTNQEFFCGPNY